jgi:type II secretory pathway component PulJ
MISRPAHRRLAAFTLLEVVIALGLSIGAIGASLGFYHHVMAVRSNIMQRADELSSERLVMTRLTNELRGSIFSPMLQIGLQGQSGQMKYVTTVLPSQAIWTDRSPTDPQPVPQYDLQVVSYRLRNATDDMGRPMMDEQGNTIVIGLERTAQKTFSSIASEGAEISVTLLSPNVKFISFRYFDGGNWRSAWSGSDLPLAVEVTIGRTVLPEGMTAEEYPQYYETSKRVVYLPGGTKAMGATTIIQGLDAGGLQP